MPFVSAAFLIALPIGLAGYYLCRRFLPAASLPFLIAASILFIAQDGIRALVILSISVLANYAIALAMVSLRRPSLAFAGVAANILYLGYFKYFDFILSGLLGGGPSTGIILPLGISFYTFHQIAFLLDIRSMRTQQLPRFLDYVAFVFFFPQLVAGPIVRAEQFFPQLPRLKTQPVSPTFILAGAAALLIGLAKKSVLADNLGLYATPVFEAAASGKALSAGDSWIGALAYTFQLYFDFSGYSDMAVGIGLLLGIRLPFNFDAPYKARSVAEFWRRWHITLSTFLRDYLYVPLGGSRTSLARQCANVFIVMIVCGIWHGAGLLFIAWGAIHGLALIVHRLWRVFLSKMAISPDGSLIYQGTAWGLTFLFITCGWVLFRADSFHAAGLVYSGLVSFSTAPTSLFTPDTHNMAVLLIAHAAAICATMPSLPQLLGTSAEQERRPDRAGPPLVWEPSMPRAAALGVSAFLSITFLQEGYSAFLYFNF
ncbi:MAG: MBOAT family protein [Hyphomicrobium sp.]|uniref:MBOAT family O-acyltransferase n=1 Tax=Hyphomicrobium sp. TaxID=82 RepID=UPI0025C1F3C2|nr:MBOAT family protein [Hyphomicrobium sp.]MBX9864105.1 MBOAT family protein [Hyphomicrobium sp.]